MTDNLTKPEPAVLSPMEIRRIGALQVANIQDQALDQFLDSQREIYKDCSKETLVQALVDRDRQLALEGRQLADGRIGGRLLREFVRGILHAIDQKDAHPEAIEQMLIGMGAEPADARQIRLHGHTLGPNDTQDDRDQAFGLPKEQHDGGD